MDPSRTNRRTYLPHVDGLRSVAVLAVLLFHFGVPGLDGGYIGVDVFFVISGFLITGIIADEITSTGRLDFGAFYSRRIRRIVPALLATLGVTSILSVALLAPAELVAYGRSLAASALSVSNLFFWSESGYFDAASQTKPLLHTWSLSVEEQFYLLWPAFLYLCHRVSGRSGLAWGIVVAGVSSFAANHLLVAGQGVGYASTLFFMPHYRVFEFALGAGGYFLVHRLPPRRWVHEFVMAAGLAMIGYAIVTLREGVDFPYLNAVVPCLGTLCVIVAQRARGVAALLDNRIAVWIGRTSYSLYLVHWPIVVFVGPLLPTAGWGTRFLLMASLSLIAATLLHRFVETRFRHAPPDGTRRRLHGIALASAVLVLCGVATVASDGMTWRYRYFTPGALATTGHDAAPAGTQVSEAAFRALSAEDVENGKGRRFSRLAQACSIAWIDDAQRCFMDRPLQVLIFGNSHEPDAFNAFAHLYGADRGVNLINFGTVNDCQRQVTRDAVSSSTRELACDRRFATLNDPSFTGRLDIVVYNTHMGFDEVSRDLWEILELLQARHPSLRIVALGSYLQTATDCASLYNRFRTYDACKRTETVDYWAPDERSRSPIPQVHSLDYLYIGKIDLFCENGDMATCAVHANGEPAFYDRHHLSLGFADEMGERMRRRYGRELAKLGFPALDAP